MYQELLQKIKEAWQGLGQRERSLALGAITLLAIVVLYLVLLVPMQHDLARLRTQVPKDYTQLQWMRAQAPLAQQARARSKTVDPGSLPSAIEQSATASGLRAQVAPLESDARSLQVSLDAVAFNSVAAWLSDLQETYGVVVEDATIDAQPAPGVVNVRLRLRAAGA